MLKASIFAVAALIATPALAAPKVPTIDELAAFPKMAQFSVSPDGKHMVALEGRGEDRVILVWNTDNLAANPTVIGSKQMKIQGVQFLKNDLLAVSLWQPYDAKGEKVTKTFVSKLFITDLQGKEWREPLPLPRGRTAADDLEQAATSPTILDPLLNDPQNILVVNNVGTTSGDVYRVNLKSLKAERIQRSEEKAAGYDTDLNGDLRSRNRADTDGKGAFIATEIRDPKSGSWSEHFRSYVKGREIFEVIGFARDPNIAYVRTNSGEDRTVVREYNVSTRSLGEVVFKHRYFEAAAVRSFRFSNGAVPFGETIGIIYQGPRDNEVQWISPQFQALDKAIRSALNITQSAQTVVDTVTGAAGSIKFDTDRSYSITSFSADLKTVTFTVDGANTTPSSYLLKDGKLSLLGNLFPNLDPKALGSTSLVYYKARDGLDIPAFLTKPNAELCGPGPYRAVVHPHGGPWARDDLGFDGSSMWVPLMASRCMAVLRPQFRGSEGWGRKLWMAGDAEWGQKMQDDKDDGAKWMIEQKLAIPGRIAMFGFSYGGYSAMAAAVRPNGLYKCAIAGAGVSDIKRISARLYSSPFFRDAQAPTIKGLNPIEFADQIKIPIMVYQGERDRTVPPEQSEWFADKAKKSSQPVEFHMIKDYAHGPSWTRAINAQQLRYIDDYFAKGCGGSGL